MRTGKEIYTLFSRMLLASVYLAFFVVQFFFNFDSQGLHASNYKLFAAQATNPVKAKVDSWESKTHRFASFRLNKRFQPATSASITGFETSLPKYEVTGPVVFYHSPRLTNVVLLLQSLRAPPVTNLI